MTGGGLPDFYSLAGTSVASTSRTPNSKCIRTHTPNCGLLSMREGDWVELEYDLVTAAALTGLSQYELLTNLGDRSSRFWK